ncbi:MAG: hypothetical protein J7M25_18795 [Deltaproteobacteria bacterium]|nr:hypothetical protein [Deltaproteobacteria bacterium]
MWPWLASLMAAAAIGCSGSGAKRSFDVSSVTPNHGPNYDSVRIFIRGSGFISLLGGKVQLPTRLEGTSKTSVRLEMWQGSSQRLKEGFSLERTTVLSDELMRAEVPPGVPPGLYHLVFRRHMGLEFTKSAYRVYQVKPNRGPPFIREIRPSRVIAGQPARLSILGGNLDDPIAIILIGPLPKDSKDTQLLLQVGLGVPWPFHQARRVHLLRVSEQNAARISGTIPADLPAGKYTIQIQTSTHKGQPTDFDHLLIIAKPPAGMSERTEDFVIYFVVMGFVFLLGMIMAYRQGDVGLGTKKKRFNLAWMLAGLLFYALLIGVFQFWLSGWY